MKSSLTATFIYFIYALLICFIMNLITSGDFFLSLKTFGPEIMVFPFVILVIFIIQLVFAQMLKIKAIKSNQFKSTIVFALTLNLLITLALYAPEYKDFWTTFAVILGIVSIPFILSQWSWLRLFKRLNH